MNDEPGAWDPDAARSTAIVAVLCAGVTPRPATWLQLELLSAARRAAAGDASAFKAWLREQQRLGGARENAALLAAMNTQLRDEAVAGYRHAHPEREHLIADLLRWI